MKGWGTEGSQESRCGVGNSLDVCESREMGMGEEILWDACEHTCVCLSVCQMYCHISSLKKKKKKKKKPAVACLDRLFLNKCCQSGQNVGQARSPYEHEWRYLDARCSHLTSQHIVLNPSADAIRLKIPLWHLHDPECPGTLTLPSLHSEEQSQWQTIPQSSQHSFSAFWLASVFSQNFLMSVCQVIKITHR